MFTPLSIDRARTPSATCCEIPTLHHETLHSTIVKCNCQRKSAYALLSLEYRRHPCPQFCCEIKAPASDQDIAVSSIARFFHLRQRMVRAHKCGQPLMSCCRDRVTFRTANDQTSLLCGDDHQGATDSDSKRAPTRRSQGRVVGSQAFFDVMFLHFAI